MTSFGEEFIKREGKRSKNVGYNYYAEKDN